MLAREHDRRDHHKGSASIRTGGEDSAPGASTDDDVDAQPRIEPDPAKGDRLRRLERGRRCSSFAVSHWGRTLAGHEGKCGSPPTLVPRQRRCKRWPTTCKPPSGEPVVLHRTSPGCCNRPDRSVIAEILSLDGLRLIHLGRVV